MLEKSHEGIPIYLPRKLEVFSITPPATSPPAKGITRMDLEPHENKQKQPMGITCPMASVLAIAVGLTRLIPHPWNLTPSGAAELFSGARLRSWHAFALPLGVRLLTDLILFPVYLPQLSKPYLYLSMLPFVYASIFINVLLGRLLSRTESPWKIGMFAVLASAQFFVVTNFGTWLGSEMYPLTPPGLLACYEAGLPFFRMTFLGDLLFSSVLFGAHAWLSRTSFPAERVPAPAK